MSDGEKKVAIQTSRFGTIEAPEEKGISISGGLLGFPESTRYLMLDHDQDSPFKWLQSMDEGEVAFVVTDPLVLLADEPTGNLDTARSREIMELITRLNTDQGITVVMVTHEPDMAEFARRHIHFVDGRIASDDTRKAA